MIEISSATSLPYENRREYLVEVAGGTLQVERQLPDGTYVDVANSPLADGDSMFVCTESFPNADATGTYLRFTPSATSFVTFGPTKR